MRRVDAALGKVEAGQRDAEGVEPGNWAAKTGVMALVVGLLVFPGLLRPWNSFLVEIINFWALELATKIA
jgi:hypothetical protein